MARLARVVAPGVDLLQDTVAVYNSTGNAVSATVTTYGYKATLASGSYVGQGPTASGGVYMGGQATWVSSKVYGAAGIGVDGGTGDNQKDDTLTVNKYIWWDGARQSHITWVPVFAGMSGWKRTIKPSSTGFKRPWRRSQG